MTRERSRIALARTAAGLSQAELAERLGLSRAWISIVERAPGLASPDVLRRLAVALGLEPLAFLGESLGSSGGPRIVAAPSLRQPGEE